MLRRQVSAVAQTACRRVRVAAPLALCNPHSAHRTSALTLMYAPPGTGRDSGGLPWYSSQQSPARKSSPKDAAAAPEGVPDVEQQQRQQQQQQQPSLQTPSRADSTPRETPAQPAASTVAVESAVGSARGGTHGALHATPARRMPVVGGAPSLETRIEDIVKVEENLSTEQLPRVVQLLIDPAAEGVERISLSDFAAMQPRRQLLALGGKKQWLEFLEGNPYYQQVARLATESPAHDLRALQQAGIHTLEQWTEKPNLVRVSARTKSALDAAVEQTIAVYMNEVAQLVNSSNQLSPLLHHWVSDVIGKFILDSLKISVESASAALWRRRQGQTGAAPPQSAETGRSNGSQGAASALSAMLALDNPANIGSSSSTADGRDPPTAGGPVLRPGEACTLEHYHHFTQKVLSSVRQDSAAAPAGDAQAEAEIAARTHTVIAAALTQLLEQAVARHLPRELRPLYDGGYLALDRIPALLRRAVSFLQVRSIPVSCFVFHSVDSQDAAGPAPLPPNGAAAAAASSTGRPGQLNVGSSKFGPGAFLTGSEVPQVTLGEWSGTPLPPSSTSSNSDPVEREYLSVLHRLKKHTDKLSMTGLYEIIDHADSYGAHGFNCAEALGLGQLFGHAKLVEDRLVSLLSYPPATSRKPMHFVEAGSIAGKTAILERLAQRTRPGERAVMVRYGGSAMPFVPDLDDHPVAFASRFWFRVALSSCPFLVRTEELYSRAPRSVMWWGNAKNWSWEGFQRLIASASHVGWRRGARPANDSLAAQPQISAILVDDFDRVLDAMEAKWSHRSATSGVAALSSASGAVPGAGVPGAAGVANSSPANGVGERVDADDDDDDAEEADDHDGDQEDDAEEGGAAESTAEGGDPARAAAPDAKAARAAQLERRRAVALVEADERRLALTVWEGLGKTIPELLASTFTKLSVALGQLDFVFTGQRVSPLLQHYTHASVRRYFVPIANGVGLPQRLRMLPLLSMLHALHLRSGLAMPGLLYEVMKSCPAMTGKTVELFWSGRVAPADLRASATATAPPRLLYGDSGPLVCSYAPRELFAELSLRHRLLRHPRRARLRLVELLQRQLSSPTGYLSTGIDTVASDVASGLVAPHSHTTAQVHPFALFTIFSHQEALEAGPAETAASQLLPSPSSKERRVVRAWSEVWAEYHTVVRVLATTPERKRDAMRVLLHGALLLRSAAVAGAHLDLNLKVPNYGFPLLATEVRMKGKHVVQAGGDGAEVRPATTDTVRKAIAAYKSFFSNATQSHFPFRPMVGLNGGCDVVCVSGTTLGLYDIVTTTQELREVAFRFAEALIGVLHVLERQVMPVDKVKHVEYITVVSIDQAITGGSTLRARAGEPSSSAAARAAHGGNSSNHNSGVNAPYGASTLTTPVVPYLLDLFALFDDSVLDRLRALQEPLGISQRFLTLSDILDHLERRFNVRVHQETVASQEELEALLSPTLLQLVPDATVLPPYTQTVVSAEELMLEAMSMNSRGRASSAGQSASILFDDGTGEDDDMDALHPRDADADAENLLIAGSGGRTDALTGAEVDDVDSDRMLSADKATAASLKQDALLADNEMLHESAELLEAMLNDQLDVLTDSSARSAAARATTARELRDDLAAENRINYGGGGASAAMSPTAAAASSAGASSTASAAPRANGAEMDSLAWLHDIITPDSLLASAQSAAGPVTAATAAATGFSPSPSSAAATGTAPPQPPTAAADAGAFSSGLQDAEEDDVEALRAVVNGTANHPQQHDDEEQQQQQQDEEGEAEGADGVESAATVFPLTAAKRKAAAGRSKGSVDLGKLLDAVGARTSKARRAAADGSSSARGGRKSTRRTAGAGNRRGGRTAAPPKAKKAKAAAPPKTKKAAAAAKDKKRKSNRMK